MKLFISWAWIDHIAWGHDNTLVRGILVSAYSLTFSLPKLDQMHPKLPNNAIESVFLCFWMCRYGYLWKDEKSRENDKTSTRFGKVSIKPEPEKLSGQSKAHGILKFQKLQEWPLVISLKKWHIWSFNFQGCYFWSSWRYFEKLATQALQVFTKYHKRPLELYVRRLAALALVFSDCTSLVPWLI